MSTTSTSPTSTRPSRKQDAASPRVPGRRRRWVWVTASVLIAAAVAGNAALMTHLADREPMLVLARDVAWGQRVSGDDVVEVNLPAEIGKFTVSSRSTIVGQIARRNLRAGNLLGRHDLTSQVVPGPGQRVVGLRLDPGRYPAGGLTANDPIAVRPAPDDTTAGSSEAQGTSEQEFLARVVRTSPPDADGAVTADVLIPETTATDAAEAAVGGAQVSLLGPARQ